MGWRRRHFAPLANRIGTRTGEDRRLNRRCMADPVSAGQPPRLTQRQIIGIVRREDDMVKAARLCTYVSGRFIKPAGKHCLVMVGKTIERALFFECSVDEAAARHRVRGNRAELPPACGKLTGECAERLWQQPLEPLAQRLGEPGRRAAGTHGNQHRIAVDDGRQGEITIGRSVNGIDQNGPRLQSGDRRPRLIIIGNRNNGKRCEGGFVDDYGTGAGEERAFGRRHFALAKQNDGTTG